LGTDPDTIRLIYRGAALSPEAVQEEILAFWEAYERDPSVLEDVQAAGIEVGDSEDERRDLVTASSAGAGFEPLSILIVAAGVVANDLWKRVILPRIEAKYGPKAAGIESGRADEDPGE
jgi:hypothetical protein